MAVFIGDTTAYTTFQDKLLLGATHLFFFRCSFSLEQAEQEKKASQRNIKEWLQSKTKQI